MNTPAAIREVLPANSTHDRDAELAALARANETARALDQSIPHPNRPLIIKARRLA